jgi:hypothetical protein
MLGRRTINVRLNADELAALRAVAEREDRPARLQAARLIRDSLIQAGALNDPKAEPVGGPDGKPAA